tara:strand:+ start:146 stop:850 length:705 start_codon:yes stop_codon:yes gene_type:complete
MALPKLNTPTHQLELPSTGEKIKYRPFLVKEQKLLMFAQESDDEDAVADTILNIIESCTEGEINAKMLPVFDIEYIFLQLRAKSVGETANIKVKCPDDDSTYVDKTIKLDEIHVQMTAGHTNIVRLTDSIKMVLTYPIMSDMKGVDFSDGISGTFNLISKCISEIHDGETIHNRVDMTDQELDEFIDTLDTQQFENIMEFFNTMPKLRHIISVTNPKTKKKGEVVLEGLDSFLV